ncbi:hypothetical protein ACKVMT_15730 [Halobacteriales archaeon Cl-PHB]
MRVYVDVTPLYDLGMVGEMDLLTALDGDLVVPDAIRAELDVEPAAANLEHLIEEEDVETDLDLDSYREDARAVLGDAPEVDVTLVAAVLAERDRHDGEGEFDVGLVSDDKRLRRVAEGLGATVTGTFGVVTHASLGDKYFPTSQAKRVIRRTDSHGLVTTGPLREQAIGDVGESG